MPTAAPYELRLGDPGDMEDNHPYSTIQANLTVASQYEIAALAAAVSFFGYMLVRGITGGLIDSSRAASGSVTPADVGQPHLR